MIHRGDAQMNSYRYDRTTSAEDTPEMHRSLLVCTGLMWVAGCRAFEKTENRYGRFKFNRSTTFAILAKESWTSPPRGPSWGPRFPMIWWFYSVKSSIRSLETSAPTMISQLQQQKRCGCYSSEWTFDSFWFCILARRETNSGVCETLSMSDRCWCDTCKSGFTYFLTYKVPCHLCIWCKYNIYAKCCYLHCFLILIDHVACESIQMLKTEKRRKKQGSYTRTGLLAHPGILYVLQLGREDSKCFAVSTKASPHMDKSGLSW